MYLFPLIMVLFRVAKKYVKYSNVHEDMLCRQNQVIVNDLFSEQEKLRSNH